MLTQTTETAIRVMIHLARQPGETPVPIRQVGDAVGGSATYIAKTTRKLVEAGLLRSFRGASGGVRLSSPPDRITLLEIVEAAQGVFEEDYCRAATPDEPTCAFHCAMVEAHAALIESLSNWTLAQLAVPGPDQPACRMLL